jgi:hypothetical protein
MYSNTKRTYSSMGGNLASSAISNLYYPQANRGVGLVFGKFRNRYIRTDRRKPCSGVHHWQIHEEGRSYTVTLPYKASSPELCVDLPALAALPQFPAVTPTIPARAKKPGLPPCYGPF